MNAPLDDAVDAVTETFPHLFDSKEKCREVLSVAFAVTRGGAWERARALREQHKTCHAGLGGCGIGKLWDEDLVEFVDAVLGEATKQ